MLKLMCGHIQGEIWLGTMKFETRWEWRLWWTRSESETEMLRACEEQMYKCPSKKLWKVGHGGSEEKLDRQKKYVRKEIRQNMIYLKLNEDMHLDRRIWKMISQRLVGSWTLSSFLYQYYYYYPLLSFLRFSLLHVVSFASISYYFLLLLFFFLHYFHYGFFTTIFPFHIYFKMF